MKTNEAPEKIYVHVKNDKVTNIWNSTLIGVRDIEYTRTEAFIDKVVDFINQRFYVGINNQITSKENYNSLTELIKDFEQTVKGE